MARITHILQKTAFFPQLLLLVTLIQIGIWAADREPPTTLVSYRVTPAAVGGTVFVNASVTRDLGRKCSMELSRHMYDSKGYRWDLTDSQRLSSESIERNEEVSPGKSLLAFQVPAGAAPGPARLVSVLNYECNPLHKILPIRQTVVINFEVLRDAY